MKDKKNVLVIIGDPASPKNRKIRHILNKGSFKYPDVRFTLLTSVDITTNTVEGKYGFEDRINRIIEPYDVIIADYSDGYLIDPKVEKVLQFVNDKEDIIFSISLFIGSTEVNSSSMYFNDKITSEFGEVPVMIYSGTSTFYDRFQSLFETERKQLHSIY